eukprot:c46081_g1_i1 orf=151-369(+)
MLFCTIHFNICHSSCLVLRDDLMEFSTIGDVLLMEDFYAHTANRQAPLFNMTEDIFREMFRGLDTEERERER